MAVRLLAALGAALVLASCGGTSGDTGSPAESAAGSDAGTAELWITRDRGGEVLLEATVPAGLTVMQALDQVAEIETRYGGRYVQSIDGVSGGLAEQQDWFYFLNGIEPDRGAAEIRLRPGDVAWWDFRSWSEEMQQPVVVGAFPEPFVQGFAGVPRPVEVRAPSGLADAADALRALLGAGASGTGPPNVFELVVEPGANGATLRASRGPGNDDPVTFTLAGSEAAVRAAALGLAADPSLVRYRYVADFDETGGVSG